MNQDYFWLKAGDFQLFDSSSSKQKSAVTTALTSDCAAGEGDGCCHVALIRGWRVSFSAAHRAEPLSVCTHGPSVYCWVWGVLTEAWWQAAVKSPANLLKNDWTGTCSTICSHADELPLYWFCIVSNGGADQLANGFIYFWVLSSFHSLDGCERGWRKEHSSK